MADRQRVIGTLGQMMYQAARASVAKGAIYDPGEHISQDAETAWKGIAEAIIEIIEQGIVAKNEEGKEIQRGKDT